MAIWLVGGLFAGLILAHMVRSRFIRHRISSARFFSDLPLARQQRPRLRWGNPLRSRPLWLQIPVVLLLLAALIYARRTILDKETLGFGVWVLVDTSASMSTASGTSTRMDAANVELAATLDRIESLGRELCLKISTFDMEISHIGETQSAAAARQLLEITQPRQLGTDLNLVRSLAQALEEQEQAQCPITHLVVISDMPAPSWVTEFQSVAIVWRDVGTAESNVGFTTVQASRDPLTGQVRRVDLSLRAFGPAPTHTRLETRGPGGDIVAQEVITWPTSGRWRSSFNPTVPGRYRVRLLQGGAYTIDDEIRLDIDDERAIRVDWRLADRQIINALGWSRDTQRPHLRVMPLPVDDSDIPTLYVGDASSVANGEASEIRDFQEGNPLLADLNLDVVESLPLAGIPLPTGFEPVLRRTDDRVWLARRNHPAAAYVPGLPAGDENMAAFSSTTFFNAVRWLLGKRGALPFVHLDLAGLPTSRGQPSGAASRRGSHL